MTVTYYVGLYKGTWFEKWYLYCKFEDGHIVRPEPSRMSGSSTGSGGWVSGDTQEECLKVAKEFYPNVEIGVAEGLQNPE